MNGIKTFRLQPIMLLHNAEKYGYEVLSEIPDSTNYAQWFQALDNTDLVNIWQWQFEHLAPLFEEKKMFLNLTIAAVSTPELVKQLLPQARHSMLELQDPENLAGLNEHDMTRLRDGLRTLRQGGVKLWLDDYRPQYDEELSRLGWFFDGVKIDHEEFHLCRRSPLALADNVRRARQFGAITLVEGIENKEDYLTAQRSKANLGQGYLWPEVRIQA